MNAQTRRSPPRSAVALLLAVPVAFLAAASAAEVPAGLAGSGVALVPADAAFLSATLRGREQFDRFANSNAYAALRRLPVVTRALESLEEQRTMPGSPFSMIDAFLQLPENAEAVELLADMVATDMFVYGEQSCTKFVKLMRMLGAMAQTIGGMPNGDGVIIEELEIFEAGDGDEAAASRMHRRHFIEIEDGGLPAGALPTRMFFQTLADNLDLLVVPDVVWGFRTTKIAAAKSQLARLEALAQAVGAVGPDAPVGVARQQVAGGEFLVLTARGAALPWDEIRRGVEEDLGDIEGVDEVWDRLAKLDVDVALGVIGDRVILSIGDSTDHLAKLAAGGDRKRLLGLPACAPLRAHADKPLTAVSYMSSDMMAALAQSPEDVRQQWQQWKTLLDAAGVGDEVVEDVRQVVEPFLAAVAKRLPEPGAWTAFSFLTDSGYEGYAWDWSRNQALDGTRRLDLLEHAGGAPLAVFVARLKGDPQLEDDTRAFLGGLWSVFETHGLPGLDDESEERVEEMAERFAPLVRRLGDVVCGKIDAALDDQVGLVIDGKSRTKKPQSDLPASAEPLPLPEPAIVLRIKDAKLFREGLSDLFALGDEAVAALREIAPDAVPEGYRMPDPVKEQVAAGTVWAFAIPDAGLDEQLRPAIGVGDDVAVFSLAPKQAARLLGAARLETGSQLSTFEEPLARAAAVDVAGLVDAVEPWLAYLTRYGCVRERDGAVAADAELDAADETEQAREALQTVDVVLDVARCLRAAVAETAFREDALVTHWRNVIRDLPKRR